MMLDLEQLIGLVESHRECLKAPVKEFELREKHFSCNGIPDIMGVVNLSRDSWYRESVCLTAEQAIRRGHRLVAEGAAMVDIGAESTLQNARLLDAELQKSALLPVVRELAGAGVLVSVETYHTGVAEACLKAGAAVLNLTGMEASEDIYKCVADHEAAVVICYVQGSHVRNVGDFKTGEDHTRELQDYFSKQIELATQAGVRRIWIDPGLGFYYKNLQDSSARVRYQIETLLNSFRLRTLGWPVCHALPHAFEYFEDEVRTAEVFFAVMAILGKTQLLRTHEVGKVTGVIRSMNVWRGGK